MRPPAAHVKGDDPSRCCGNQQQPEKAEAREGSAEHARRDGQGKGRPQRRFPVDRVRIPYHFAPALRLPCRRGGVGGVDQLRQTANRAEAISRLHGLVATAAGELHIESLSYRAPTEAVARCDPAGVYPQRSGRRLPSNNSFLQRPLYSLSTDPWPDRRKALSGRCEEENEISG